MSITDELRTEARGFGDYIYTSEQAEHLTAIADRIDAEHEKMLVEMGNTCYFYDKKENECMCFKVGGYEKWLAGHGWIRLPKDADGEYVYIDDVMEWPNGETFEVVGIGDGTLFYIDDSSEQADWTGASTKRHHKPSIVEDVEDVLREFLEDWRASTIADGDDIIAEYAAKLQLRGEDE